MPEAPYERLEVSVPPTVVAVVDKIASGISGVIDATIVDKERHVTTGKVDITVIGDNVGLAKDSTLSSTLPRRVTQVDTGQIGILNWPTNYPLPSDQITTLTTTGTVKVTDITGTIADKTRYVTSGRVDVANWPATYDVSDRSGRALGIITNVASGTVNVFTPGAFNQWTNVSITSGSTITYGPFDISSKEIKTVGVWSNTGDVRVTTLVSNDGTTYKSYDTVTVTSGTSTTRSFTEAFSSMRVDILGLTDAGYTIMISRL